MLHWPLWVVSMGWGVAGISLQRVELNHSNVGEAMPMGDTEPLQMPRSFLSMRRPSRWAISGLPLTARGPGRTRFFFTSFAFFQGGEEFARCCPPIYLPATYPPCMGCKQQFARHLHASVRHLHAFACHLPATCMHFPATNTCLPAICLPLACHIDGCPPPCPPPFCPPCPVVGRVVFGMAPFKVERHDSLFAMCPW